MLEMFLPATRLWFSEAFAAPTAVQEAGWAAISRHEHALLLAPTGSGKTLAAFLWALDMLMRLPPDAPPGVRVVYVSPLKALVYDIERNLRGPLAGILRAAERAGQPLRQVGVDIRTGDTPQALRRQQLTDRKYGSSLALPAAATGRVKKVVQPVRRLQRVFGEGSP